ncbi:hypothetical protein DL98DRAFT_633998 [Cadophora sp. DSE1049]|nr:hypothetical protein DL98DRAFT_633998 [Cadophora sp. DSE1049]
MSYTVTLVESSSFATMTMSDSSPQIERRASPGEVGGDLPLEEVAEAVELPTSGRLLRGIIRALAAGTLLLAQAVPEGHDTVPHEHLSLSNMPVEVKLHIISFIEDDSDGLYTKACLALTCSKMYQAYKIVRPEPIAWDVGRPLIDSKGHSWEYALQHHIGVFLGPAYRRHRFDPRFIFPFKKWPAFLTREVYGIMYNMKEIELNNRYSDWGGLSTEPELRLYELAKSLPSPFGLGEEWYGLASKALWKLHMNGYADARSKGTGLRRPPTYLFVYKLMMREYEEFYDGFEEWIVMMGV